MDLGDHLRTTGGAQELGHCPTPGLSDGWSALADRTLHPACSAGSDVGCNRSRAPDRAALWAAPRVIGTRSRRSHQMDGLGAPFWRPCTLCHHCPARRVFAPAIHNEKDREGSYLGIRLYADRARSALAILGSTRRRPLARRLVCLPSTPRKDSATRFAEVKQRAPKSEFSAFTSTIPLCTNQSRWRHRPA